MTRLGEILPAVVETLLDRVDDPTNYEPCPHCHRPSWSFLQWSVQQAAQGERNAIEWEEFAAGEEISARERLTAMEFGRALLNPHPVSNRKHLRVLP